ncbi:MAG: hypothetical protein DHS80DRAFT_32834 [Piptocephalis tieghemiana]|nr:MAG: hypothetical protein DHS80DRAFT_32834 [Piptocephalis tieghemiana]
MSPGNPHGHSHRPGSLAQSNKAFKSRHASKTQLRDKAKGKVSRERLTGVKGGARRSTSMAQSKADRKNAARLEQQKKRHSLLVNAKLFSGRHGVPKICLLLPLCPDVSGTMLMKQCWESEGQTYQAPPPPSPSNPTLRPQCSHTLSIPRHKQSIQFIDPGVHDFIGILDAAKVADFILPILSATVEATPFAEHLLRSIQAQGSPMILPVVQGLQEVPLKKQVDVKKSLTSFISYFFPEALKIHELSSITDASLLTRSICNNLPKPASWSKDHPYLLADEITFVPQPEDGGETGELVVSGYARGNGHFSANRLVHLPGHGDFQLKYITTYHPPALRPSDEGMAVEETLLEQPDPERQDTLQTENEPDFMNNEQTWPTEEEMAEGEARMREAEMQEAQEFSKGHHSADLRKRGRRLPAGTSSYQAAWIVDEVAEEADSMSEDSDEDEMEDGMEDGMERTESLQGEVDEEDMRSTIHDDALTDGEEDGMLGEEEEARQLEEYLKGLKQRQREDRDDLEFPDEVDTPQDVSARVRFQRYRGLESFHQSPWDPYENLPMDYARIFQFENWSRTATRVLRAGKEEGQGIGTPITLHIIGVPRQVVEEGVNGGYSPFRLFLVFGLLQYENKVSLLNFTIARDSEFHGSVKSKDPLVMQCGFRRYSVRPLYSQHTQRGKNNVHKFERFLRPGSVSVATIYGPVHFGRMPTTFFREESGGGEGSGLALVGTGKLLSVEPTRIIAKRIVLTGYPFKVHTRSAVVRYMFFSREDIEWFKPVKVTTKFGKVGHIKEPLGTHGYMKVQFDGPIKQHDTVCMNLYKRVFPKWSTMLWKAPVPPVQEKSMDDAMAMEE